MGTSDSLQAEALAEKRAEISLGISNSHIYASIRREIGRLQLSKNSTLVDVGCGRGHLWPEVQEFFDKYVGVDLVRHSGLDPKLELVVHNLNTPGVPLADNSADVVILCETLPHVENPRLVVRECARICKPGGWVIIHHPNCLSFVSMATLFLRQRFTAFQDGSSDFMITPLLECDLHRMTRESGLIGSRTFYAKYARLPAASSAFPGWLSRAFPRLFSDNLGVIAQKPPLS